LLQIYIYISKFCREILLIIDRIIIITVKIRGEAVVSGIKINYLICAAAMCLASGSFSLAGAAVDSLKPGAENKTAPATAVAPKSNVKQIVFEEQKIEGKIRRPQLVLIKADQRPEFTPMIMQAVGKTKAISGLIDEDLINSNTSSRPFTFEGTKVQYTSP